MNTIVNKTLYAAWHFAVPVTFAATAYVLYGPPRSLGLALGLALFAGAVMAIQDWIE